MLEQVPEILAKQTLATNFLWLDLEIDEYFMDLVPGAKFYNFGACWKNLCAQILENGAELI